MNGAQFSAALGKLRRGERMVYHNGLLMADRCYHVDADSVARAAMSAYTAEKCLLFQRRVDQRVCQYIAVKL
jgi:late competence protein required for DNA uptake (superfamily II DNA/RNA helicase)